MEKNNESILATRSVNALQVFYTMVLSLAVVQSVQQIIDINYATNGIIFKTEYAVNFLVFIFLVIPFYQGAIRYLDETYITGKRPVLKKLQGLIDVLFFFFEGMIFYSMALAIPNNHDFYLATLIVLTVDIIWLGSVYFANHMVFLQIKWWLFLNVIAIFIILFSFSMNCLDEKSKYLYLGAVMFLRTILDYSLTGSFYWPGALPSSINNSIKEEENS